MASRNVVAKRYSKALLLQAKSADAAAAWLPCLLAISESVRTSVELKKLFSSPVFSPEDKWAVLESLSKKFNADKELENFFRVLLKARRMGAIGEIAEQFKQQLYSSQNTVEATVEFVGDSSSDLSSLQKQNIQEMLEKSFAKKVILKTKQEPSLLAGFRITIAGMTYDASLQSNIEQIHKNLLSADFARKGVRAEA
jgi:F-type H+-transporting ATPase subunit delta